RAAASWRRWCRDGAPSTVLGTASSAQDENRAAREGSPGDESVGEATPNQALAAGRKPHRLPPNWIPQPREASRGFLSGCSRELAASEGQGSRRIGRSASECWRRTAP